MKNKIVSEWREVEIEGITFTVRDCEPLVADFEPACWKALFPDSNDSQLNSNKSKVGARKNGTDPERANKRNSCVCPELEVKKAAEKQSDDDSDGRGENLPRSSNQEYSGTFQGGGKNEC